MSPTEIKAWLSDLKENGMRIQFVDRAPVVRLKNGKILGQIGEFKGYVVWVKKEKVNG